MSLETNNIKKGEVIIEYSKSHLNVDLSRLVNKNQELIDELENYSTEPNRLNIELVVTGTSNGISANIAVAVPPSEEAQDDLWEASRKKGEWDFYAFGFITIDYQDNEIMLSEGLTLKLLIENNTFFEKAFELVREFNIRQETNLMLFNSLLDYFSEEEYSEDKVSLLISYLHDELDARILEPLD